MKAHVNEACIGCGLCRNICPDVFRMTEENVAEAYGEVTQDLEESVAEARDSCPVEAIETE